MKNLFCVVYLLILAVIFSVTYAWTLSDVYDSPSISYFSRIRNAEYYLNHSYRTRICIIVVPSELAAPSLKILSVLIFMLTISFFFFLPNLPGSFFLTDG